MADRIPEADIRTYSAASDIVRHFRPELSFPFSTLSKLRFQGAEARDANVGNRSKRSHDIDLGAFDTGFATPKRADGERVFAATDSQFGPVWLHLPTSGNLAGMPKTKGLPSKEDVRRKLSRRKIHVRAVEKALENSLLQTDDESEQKAHARVAAARQIVSTIERAADAFESSSRQSIFRSGTTFLNLQSAHKELLSRARDLAKAAETQEVAPSLFSNLHQTASLPLRSFDERTGDRNILEYFRDTSIAEETDAVRVIEYLREHGRLTYNDIAVLLVDGLPSSGKILLPEHKTEHLPDGTAKVFREDARIAAVKRVASSLRKMISRAKKNSPQN